MYYYLKYNEESRVGTAIIMGVLLYISTFAVVYPDKMMRIGHWNSDPKYFSNAYRGGQIFMFYVCIILASVVLFFW